MQHRKFVLVNYSNRVRLRPFHGKAVALDVGDRHAPFPGLFIIHEMRVRGHHPFAPVTLDVPDEIPWQDWLVSKGVVRSDGYFNRECPPLDADIPSGIEP